MDAKNRLWLLGEVEALAAQGASPPVNHELAVYRPVGKDDPLLLDRWRELMAYDPEGGELYSRMALLDPKGPRRERMTYSAGPGHSVKMFVLDGIRAKACDVVWFLNQGEWPWTKLKRIDNDETNIRFENLYETCFPVIEPVRRLPGASRYGPVWQAYGFHPDGRRKNLGTYATEEKAAQARIEWDAGRWAVSRRKGVRKTPGGRWQVFDDVGPLSVHTSFLEACAVREAWESRQAVSDLV